MDVKVEKITEEESVLKVKTNSGTKKITINKLPHGYSYDDFAEWDITDEQYYALEDLVDNITEKMRGRSPLNVDW